MFNFIQGSTLFLTSLSAEREGVGMYSDPQSDGDGKGQGKVFVQAKSSVHHVSSFCGTK